MAHINQTASSRFPRPERVTDAEHTVVYYDPEYFAGMVFNNNFWAFSDGEILINFTRARCSYKDSYDLWHFVVDGLHGEYVTLRSTDGGKTWPLDSLQLLGTHQSLERQVVSGLAPEGAVRAARLDFARLLRHHRDLAVHRSSPSTWATRSTRATGDEPGRAPFRMPSMGFEQVYMKPDYLVRPDGLVLLFVTVGRGPVTPRYNVSALFQAVYATTDGGAHVGVPLIDPSDHQGRRLCRALLRQSSHDAGRPDRHHPALLHGRRRIQTARMGCAGRRRLRVDRGVRIRRRRPHLAVSFAAERLGAHQLLWSC